MGNAYPFNLVWLGNRRIMYEQSGRLIAMNTDGSEHRVIIDNFNNNSKKPHNLSWYKKRFRFWKVLHTLPQNPEEILVQSTNSKGDASVKRINIFTGESTNVASNTKSKISSWVVDKTGSVILGVGYNKGQMNFYLRESPDSNKIKRNRQFSLSGSIDQYDESRFNFNGRSFLNTKVFINQGSYIQDIIYVSENIDSDKFKLSRYSISQKKIISIVHEDNEYDIGGLNNNISLHFDKIQQKLIGVSYLATNKKTVWFDDRFNQFQIVLNKNFPTTVNSILDWTNDLTKLLIYTESSQNTGIIYVYYPKDKRIVQQVDFSELFENIIIPKTQVVHFLSVDGVKHEAYLTLPNGYDSTPLPTVIQVHGGPWWRYSLDYDPEAIYFATRGYAVLRVNFRGSTGFGRNYLLSGIKNIATLMLDDIADGAKWMIDQNYTNAQKLYIMGSSYGGYAALMSTTRHPNLFKAAASLAAPLNLVTQISDYKKNDNYFAYEYWNYAVGDLKNDKKALQNISPYYNIDKMNTPFIIFHGENDSIVSVKQVTQFQKLLKKKNIDAKIRIIKDEGHGLNFASNRFYYMETSLRLFESSVN